MSNCPRCDYEIDFLEHPSHCPDCTLRIYSASSIGYCPRVMAAPHMGYDPMSDAEFMSRAAREGNRHEDWVVEDLKLDGYKVFGRQEEVIHFEEGNDYCIVGHTDGTIAGADLDDLHLLEVKALSRFQFAKFLKERLDAFPHYAWQISFYMFKQDLQKCFFIMKNRDTGERSIYITSAPFSPEKIIERIKAIEDHINLGLPIDTLPCTCDDFMKNWGNYRYLCRPELDLEKLVKKDPAADSEIAAALTKLRRSREIEEEAKELKEQAEGVLIGVVAEVGTVRGEGIVVSWVKPTKTTSYPVAELKKVVDPEVLKLAERVSDRRGYLRVEVL